MNILEFTAGNKVYYFKTTKRSIRRWQNKDLEKRERADLSSLTLDEDMDFILESIREGFMLNGKSFDVTLQELYDVDAEFDLTSILNKVQIDRAKKQIESSKES